MVSQLDHEGEEYKAIEMYQFDAEDITRNEQYTIDASSEDEPFRFGRLINHSPLVAHTNVKPQFKKWESSEGTKRRLGNVKSIKSILFHATKTNKPGEELLWNYGKHYDDFDWYQKCPCKLCQPNQLQ